MALRPRRSAEPLRVFSHRHWYSLFPDDVMNCCSHLPRLPQVPGAAMVGPPPSAKAVQACCLQGVGCLHFDVSQYLFGRRLCGNHQVNVARTDMDCQQLPTSVRANLSEGFQDCGPSSPIQCVRPLLHPLLFRRDRCLVWGKEGSSRNIVVPIHRASFISVQSRAVACKGDEVGKGNWFCHKVVYGRGVQKKPLAYGRGSDGTPMRRSRSPKRGSACSGSNHGCWRM